MCVLYIASPIILYQSTTTCDGIAAFVKLAYRHQPRCYHSWPKRRGAVRSAGNYQKGMQQREYQCLEADSATSLLYGVTENKCKRLWVINIWIFWLPMDTKRFVKSLNVKRITSCVV